MRAPSVVSIQVQPNVTPMIDVMLVLLIIFMTVGPLLEHGFPLVPPTGRHLTQHPDESWDWSRSPSPRRARPLPERLPQAASP